MNSLLGILASACFGAAFVGPRPYCYAAAICSAALVVWLRSR